MSAKTVLLGGAIAVSSVATARAYTVDHAHVAACVDVKRCPAAVTFHGHTYPAGKREIDLYYVDQPVVNSATATVYRDIEFHKGDQVHVTAGGCVNMGGHNCVVCDGHRWKSYVHPIGDGSDRMYFGTISIPSSTPPIGGSIAAAVNAGTITIGDVKDVADPAHPHAYLSLGYADDKYSDNNYSSHDDGDSGQCKGQGAAWVMIEIDRQPAGDPVVVTPAPAAPMDLWAAQTDYNNLPLNPMWGYQLTHNAPPDAGRLCDQDPIHSQCTTQSPTADNLWWGNPFGVAGCHGKCQHANWMPGTYTGTARWEGHDPAFLHDDDYNIYVLPDAIQPYGVPGITKNSPSGIKAEFSAGETINHFTTSWWNTFHAAVDKGDATARALVDGKRVIAIGLVGLDCVQHGQSGTSVSFDYDSDCHPELHPAHALAIQTATDKTSERWSMFARKWGGEGECSQNQHGLDRTSVFFEIPRPGATGVRVDKSSFEANGSGGNWTVHFVAGEGAVVELELPADEPGQHGTSGDPGPFIDGELVLEWEGPVREPIGAPAPRRVEESRGLDAESHDLDAVVAKLDEPARQRIKTELARAFVRAPMQRVSGGQRAAAPGLWKSLSKPSSAPYKRLQIPAPLVRHDEGRRREAQRLETLLCREFKGRLPVVPPAKEPALKCLGSSPTDRSR